MTSENACRSRMLLRYFGEKNLHNCGQCDICLSHRATDEPSADTVEELKEQLFALLEEQPLTPADIGNRLETKHEALSQTIQYLLDENELEMKDGLIHKRKLD